MDIVQVAFTINRRQLSLADVRQALHDTGLTEADFFHLEEQAARSDDVGVRARVALGDVYCQTLRRAYQVEP